MKTYPSVERCKRDIIRLVCTSDLREGDQLPPQSDLCALFMTGNRTLSAAMQSLVELGLLSRKTRTGTIIADLSALERIPWRIGVSSISAAAFGPLAFFAMLHHQTVSLLSEANCHVMTYLRRRTFHLPHEIRDFPGLAESLNQGNLDGLILLTDLNSDEWRGLIRHGLAVCHVGPFASAVSGIVIDFGHFVEEATQVLRQSGCRKIAGSAVLQSDRVSSSPGVSGSDLEWFGGGTELQGGREVAKVFLQRPVAERPDGVLAADDHFAMGFAEVLAQVGEGYRPKIACVTNRQLPLSYALPVLKWELDIQALAALAVTLIRGELLGRIDSDQVRCVRPAALPPDA